MTMNEKNKDLELTDEEFKEEMKFQDKLEKAQENGTD